MLLFTQTLRPGFIEQRNFSIEKATLKWCFMIDSDEAITLELELEIKKLSSADKIKFPMYSVMRTEYLLRPCPLNMDLAGVVGRKALFLRERVEYTGGVHHEHLIDGVHQNNCRKKLGLSIQKHEYYMIQLMV